MFEADQSGDGDFCCVTTSSQRQAMDWSLVLLSQGIESTLMRDSDTGAWQLIVPAGCLQAVREALLLYERENRAWPLRHSLPWPGFHFDWTVLAWVGVIAAFFVLQTRPGSSFETAGICNVALTRAGQWWRPVTATMLHADLGHLAMNLVFGFLLLGIAMGRFGSGIALLAATLSGTIANLFPLFWRDDRSSALGASGVVMAALGMLAADAAVQQWRRKQPARLVVEGIVSGVLMFVLLGMSPTSDIPAHAAGFVAGLVFGVPLARLPLTTIRHGRWNFLAGFAYSTLVITAWLWALSGSQ